MDYEELIKSIDFLAVLRAYKILKYCMDEKELDPVFREKFESWLTDKAHEKEKDIALRMIFDEVVHATFVDEDKLEQRLSEAMAIMTN